MKTVELIICKLSSMSFFEFDIRFSLSVKSMFKCTQICNIDNQGQLNICY